MSFTAHRDFVLDLLPRHPLFAGLSEVRRVELAESQALFFLHPGELLYETGQPAARAFAVLQGGLQIEYPTPKARRGLVTALLAAPTFLGEAQVMHDRPWRGTGVALTELCAMGLDRQAIERLCLAEPDFALRLYREVTHRFLLAIDNWAEQPHRTAQEWLARYILGYLDLAERTGAVAELPFGPTELGRASNLRRETVSRTLRRWQTLGWVNLGEGSLVVRRPAKLRGLVRGHSLLQSTGTSE